MFVGFGEQVSQSRTRIVARGPPEADRDWRGCDLPAMESTKYDMTWMIRYGMLRIRITTKGPKQALKDSLKFEGLVANFNLHCFVRNLRPGNHVYCINQRGIGLEANDKRPSWSVRQNLPGGNVPQNVVTSLSPMVNCRPQTP